MPRDLRALKAAFEAISREQIRQHKAFNALPEELRQKAFQAVAARTGSRRVYLQDMMSAYEKAMGREL